MSGSATKNKSRTDWARIDSMKDEEIDLSDIPELDEEFFKNAALWPGLNKPILLRLDPEVMLFFLKEGKNYKRAINDALRKHVEQQKQALRTRTHRRRAS